jgi:hypothetical protein
MSCLRFLQAAQICHSSPLLEMISARKEKDTTVERPISEISI